MISLRLQVALSRPLKKTKIYKKGVTIAKNGLK